MTSDPCSVHAYHSPHVTECDVHHIWPKAWGGPTTPANLVTVCPSGHRNIHELLEEYDAANGLPPWAVLREWGMAERVLAAQGWVQWQMSMQ